MLVMNTFEDLSRVYRYGSGDASFHDQHLLLKALQLACNSIRIIYPESPRRRTPDYWLELAQKELEK